MNEKELTAHELIGRFARCAKYPEDLDGINFLAEGLERAAKTTGVAMADIVDACTAISQYCPTDADLLTVARGIRDERARDEEAKRNRTAEWKRQYGKPEQFDWKAEAAKIMPAAKIHWEKDAQMLKLMRDKARERHTTLAKMGHWDRMTLRIECQEAVGLEVTPEQRREVGGR